MAVIAQTCSGRERSPYVLSENKHVGWMLKLAMDSLKAIKNLSPKEKSPDEFSSASRDYLDGYFLSLDYYPVCTRHIFSRNDAFALWSDFLKISDDLSLAASSMISTPERFMNLESSISDELESRKRKAAIRAAEHLTGRLTGPVLPDRKPDST